MNIFNYDNFFPVYLWRLQNLLSVINIDYSTVPRSSNSQFVLILCIYFMNLIYMGIEVWSEV